MNFTLSARSLKAQSLELDYVGTSVSGGGGGGGGNLEGAGNGLSNIFCDSLLLEVFLSTKLFGILRGKKLRLAKRLEQFMRHVLWHLHGPDIQKFFGTLESLWNFIGHEGVTHATICLEKGGKIALQASGT